MLWRKWGSGSKWLIQELSSGLPTPNLTLFSVMLHSISQESTLRPNLDFKKGVKSKNVVKVKCSEIIAFCLKVWVMKGSWVVSETFFCSRIKIILNVLNQEEELGMKKKVRQCPRRWRREMRSRTHMEGHVVAGHFENERQKVFWTEKSEFEEDPIVEWRHSEVIFKDKRGQMLERIFDLILEFPL